MKRSAELFRSDDRGNAVLAAVMNITFATLITLSVLGLILSAYNMLVIRDAAIEASSRLSLPEAPSQQPFLRRLLEDSLPELASYEIEEHVSDSLVGYTIRAKQPLLGFLGTGTLEAEVLVAKETIG
jgi:hypothetical protein